MEAARLVMKCHNRKETADIATESTFHTGLSVLDVEFVEEVMPLKQ